MRSRWNDKEARSFVDKYKAHGEDLALRTYSARLIGQEPSLVLHGGGNTSVKTRVKDLLGGAVPVLRVKGSGWDLASIEPAGHPAVRLEPLTGLRALEALSDRDMVNFFRAHMLDSAGPNPSVETLLHAFLPHKFIDHTHADAVLALADQPRAADLAQEWAGGRLGVVPYIMPGFSLAKLAARVYEENPRVEGLILLKHGLFTFGETARESYERMVRWVDRAEKYLARAKPFVFHSRKPARRPDARSVGLAANFIRAQCRLSRAAAKQEDPVQRLIVRHRATPALLAFADSREAATLSQRGPATPDHILRTKAKPLVLPPTPAGDRDAFEKALRRGVEKYKAAYQAYFQRHSRRAAEKKVPLDPLPRLILAPGLGLFSAAADAPAADMALDIYEHTVDIIEKASRVGRYEVLPEAELFNMEYWSLEQAKLGKAVEKPFDRKIVWVSGAASGIGLAAAQAFNRLGAHVFLTDLRRDRLKEALASLPAPRRADADVCDVTDPRQAEKSFDLCSATFGGVDVVVSNAGAAFTGPLADCPDETFRESFEINFFSHQNVARAAARVFRRQGLGGDLLFNASKGAFNPGPDFGPYVIPKAGVVALMRQYAIELAGIGVRSNAVNADRVNTGMYAGGLLAARARARGLSKDQYLTANLLGQEVYAEDVAQAFVSLALSRKTTGAVLPVDGGNAAAFPR